MVSPTPRPPIGTPPPLPPETAPGSGREEPPKDRFSLIGSIWGLIAVTILVAGLGFFSHFFLDVFTWAWDLWGDLS